MAVDPAAGGPQEWATGLDDPIHQAPIVGYLRAIREHWRLCVVIVLAAVVGSAGWLAKRSPDYLAKASLLVNPLSETDTTLAGLPLIRAAGGDPERPVKTAATLMQSNAVIERTAELLDGELSRDQIASDVEVTPEQGENLISVEATTTDPDLSARLANAYVDAAADERRETLRPLVAETIRNTQAELDALPAIDSPQGVALQARLADLRTIANGKDPTISVAQRARPPTSPEGEPAWLVLALAVAAGIAIAAAIAILVELLVPGPIRDELDLRAVIPAPILARLPRQQGRRSRSALGDPPPAAIEGFRMLRGQLQYRLHARATGGNGGSLLRGVIAVTSPSPGDGRTGVAVGLARAVAATQSDALLIETDVRHPSLARELGIETDEDLSALLDSRGDASRIVTPLKQLPGVGAVVAPRVDNMRALEQLNMDMPDILGRARGLADCVIVDAPPLSLASDALPTLSAADQVVLVVRLGHTEREAVLAAAEVLAQRRVILAGIVVVDSPLVEEVEPPGPATRIATRRTPESTRR